MTVQRRIVGVSLLLAAVVTLVLADNVVLIDEGNDTGEMLIVTIDPQEVDLVSGDDQTFNLTVSGHLPWPCLNVSFELTGKPVATTPAPVLVCESPSWYPVVLNTTTYGYATLIVHTDPPLNTSKDIFSIVRVMKKKAITTTADVLGWMYTIAWDFSFLPQIFRNWRRHSVVGLSFDFVTLNMLGFTCYFFFNMGLFWINPIQEQYYVRHPLSILHVRLNDVIFPLYAMLCVMVQILQCIFYERGPKQRVSTPCIVIACLLLLSAVIWLILAPTVDKLLWVDFLYWLSYIKLIITCIKYIPQLYTNYKLRSTEGWSIWQVTLDFTGGALSLLQMFLLAANYDDWKSVLTDPTKLGLGLLSIFFNILFFIQHYCLYRGASVKEDQDLVNKNKNEEKIEDTHQSYDNYATTDM